MNQGPNFFSMEIIRYVFTAIFVPLALKMTVLFLIKALLLGEEFDSNPHKI